MKNIEKQWKWFLFKKMNDIIVFRIATLTLGESAWFMVWIQRNRIAILIYKIKFSAEWR